MGGDLSKDLMCCDCSQQRNQILETEVNGVSSMKLHENNQRFLRAMAEGGKSDLILGLFSTTREFDVNSVDEGGESALHKAARHGHVIVCHVLIKRGARPDLKNSDGKSALDLAKDNNHTECVEYLQEPGCVRRARCRSHLDLRAPFSSRPPIQLTIALQTFACEHGRQAHAARRTSTPLTLDRIVQEQGSGKEKGSKRVDPERRRRDLCKTIC